MRRMHGEQSRWRLVEWLGLPLTTFGNHSESHTNPKGDAVYLRQIIGRNQRKNDQEKTAAVESIGRRLMSALLVERIEREELARRVKAQTVELQTLMEKRRGSAK
jgi:hypothetical protein